MTAVLPALHPDHLADLRMSGLTDETIVRAGLYTARPGDLGRLTGRDLPEGTSGLAFPYDRDFARLKVFPPLVDGDGRRVKYLQRPGSPVRLYTVPLRLLGDPEALLADPSVRLRIVEGEKKGLALAQLGLPAVALGGLWNFRTCDLPANAVIADLEVIVWTRRVVYLYPDSDVWGNDQALEAVFRLGRLLEARGAAVLIVKLPAVAEAA